LREGEGVGEMEMCTCTVDAIAEVFEVLFAVALLTLSDSTISVPVVWS
jgi:hypothetical protein